VSDSPTYWIARHDNDEQRHRIPVYSAPPTWLDCEQRWFSRGGRAVCIIDGEENAKSLLGIESIPEPGRCVKIERSMRAFLDFCGEYAEGEALVPFVEDVTDELKAESR
jgi:hypothetical protein